MHIRDRFTTNEVNSNIEDLRNIFFFCVKIKRRSLPANWYTLGNAVLSERERNMLVSKQSFVFPIVFRFNWYNLVIKERYIVLLQQSKLLRIVLTALQTVT